MLPGDEPQPRGELAPILEVGRIAHGCDQRRRGQGANPRQLRQPLTGLVGHEQPHDLLVSRRDPLIAGLQFRGEGV
jgi:hypothetical protein